MYNQDKLIEILKKIQANYTLNEFAKLASVDSAYLSRILNKKRTNPPSPKILERLASVSRGLTSYEELMMVCGYLDFPYSASYDFANNNDRKILNMAIVYAIQNKISQNEIPKNKEIIDILNGLEQTDKNKALAFVTNMSIKFQGRDDFSLDEYVQSLSYMKQEKNDVPKRLYMCPVYGQIPAGEPNWAEEFIEGRIPIDPDMMNIANPEECFFLRVSGESMNKIIQNGDYALIRKQDFVESGEIAAVLVNGFDATLKKFKQQGDLIILEPMSNDSSFEVQIYGKDTPIKILGKLVGHFGIN